MVESLEIRVRNPIIEFVVESPIEANHPINIKWELETVPPGCMLVFRQGHIRLAERAVTSLTGSTQIPAPRAPGQFSVTLQGTNSRESQMMERQVDVQQNDGGYQLLLHEESHDIQTVLDNGRPAIVVAPGAKVDVAWKGALAEGSDSILLCWGPSSNMAHVLERVTCSSGPATSRDRQGLVTLTVPQRVGFASVLYGVRYNHVTIPAAMAHIAISDRLLPVSRQQPLLLAAIDGATATELEGSADGEGAGTDAPGLVDMISMLVASVPKADTRDKGARKTMQSPHEHTTANASASSCQAEEAAAPPSSASPQLSTAHDVPVKEEEEGGCRVDENDGSFEAGGPAAIPAMVRAHWPLHGSGAQSQERARPQQEVLCVVCLDSAVNTLIRPCNHVILCHRCAASLKLCPLDRRRIESQERIYMC